MKASDLDHMKLWELSLDIQHIQNPARGLDPPNRIKAKHHEFLWRIRDIWILNILERRYNVIHPNIIIFQVLRRVKLLLNHNDIVQSKSRFLWQRRCLFSRPLFYVELVEFAAFLILHSCNLGVAPIHWVIDWRALISLEFALTPQR